MKPISIILLALICIGCNAYAADNDIQVKKKITHHVQFLFGNYVSAPFLSPHINMVSGIYTPPGQPNIYSPNYANAFGPSPKPTLLPLYSYSLGFDYTAEFSEMLGLRTGINYFTYGYIEEGITYGEVAAMYHRDLTFNSSVHIPIDLIVHKNLKTGRLIFLVGPDIYLPTNYFGKSTTDWGMYSSMLYSHPTAIDFLKGGSLGLTAGIGYEKKISNKLAVEFMPDFRIMNIIPFDFQGQGTHIYQNYIFNVAVGLSTYITFY